MRNVFILVFLNISVFLWADFNYSAGLEVSWINSEGSSIMANSALVPQFIFGLEFPVGDLVAFVPETALSMENYAFVDRAIPVENEYLTSCETVSLRIDFPVRFTFALTDNLALYAQTGPGTVLRFPLPGIDAGALYGYFYSGFRLLDLGSAIGLKWAIYEDMDVNFRIRNLLPLYHLWDQDGVSLLDQFQLAPGVTIVF